MAKYYDLSAADARVEELGTILEALRKDRDTIAKVQRSLEQAHGSDGNGGSHDELDQRREQMASTIARMEAAVRQIDAWGISLRDIGTGLVDFPALVNGRIRRMSQKQIETHRLRNARRAPLPRTPNEKLPSS